MSIQIRKTEIPDVLVVEPVVHGDHRGFFQETYHRRKYEEAGLSVTFVQDNHSRSRKGTLRGLHYQVSHPQGKLVWAATGEIYDVAVDIRRNSPTFGKWVGMRLSDSNHLQLYIPPGFAHGFCVLSESADVLYKCTALYDAGDDFGIVWNDPDLKIQWPLSEPLLSAKDSSLPPLSRVPRERLF